MSRDDRFTGVLVGVAVALALFGYFVGHSGAPTDKEVASARAEATTSAKSTAEKRAYSAGRRRGVRDGTRDGREAGEKKGRSDGKKKTEEAAGQQQDYSTAPQTGTQQDYSTAPQNGGGTGTPSVDSPEGRQLLQSDQCKEAPPPPPGYDGPVQC